MPYVRRFDSNGRRQTSQDITNVGVAVETYCSMFRMEASKKYPGSQIFERDRAKENQGGGVGGGGGGGGAH